MFPFYASERASSKNRERRKFFDSKRPRLTALHPRLFIVLRNNQTAICDIFFFESSSSEIETFARTRNERVIIAHKKKKKERRRNQNRASSPPREREREREREFSPLRVFFFSLHLFSRWFALFFSAIQWFVVLHRQEDAPSKESSSSLSFLFVRRQNRRR